MLTYFVQDPVDAARHIRDYDGSPADPIGVLIFFAIIAVIMFLYWIYLTYFSGTNDD